MEIQRYYIAIPERVANNGYQSIPSWKNYSFYGSLEEAKGLAYKLFSREGYFEDILYELINYYGNSKEIEINWNKWSIKEKITNCEEYFNDFFRFRKDEYNIGLALWNNVSNYDKKNIYSANLNLIEL